MPWCPKCKNEYKAGYTKCSDCGCDLVEELSEEMIVAYFGAEAEVDTIMDYFASNNITCATKYFDPKEQQFNILIHEQDKEIIRTALNAFFTELQKKQINVAKEKTDNKPKKTGVYVKPEERAEEYKSGAVALITVSIVGAAFLILVDLGIIPIQLNPAGRILVNIVMGGMFIAFLALGLNSFKTYKHLTGQASSDGDLEQNVTKWFNESVTLEMITWGEDSNQPEELLYFARFEKIKNKVSSQFPDVDAKFLEYISEKLYASMFE